MIIENPKMEIELSLRLAMGHPSERARRASGTISQSISLNPTTPGAKVSHPRVLDEGII